MAAAEQLAAVLLQAKLCACVNFIPKIKSILEKIETDEEVLLIIKTQHDIVPELIETVKKNHPYQVPEVIALPIEQGNEAYLQWIADSVKKI